MEIDKLFHVLVVGGALTVGCGGAPTLPDPKPAEAPASQPEAPASQPQVQPGADDGASSGEGKEEEGRDGVCGWF